MTGKSSHHKPMFLSDETGRTVGYLNDGFSCNSKKNID